MKETIQKFKALPHREKRKTALLNIGGSLFLTANWFTFIYVMNHISVKATSLAYLICPILTTLLAYFILLEKLNKLQWISVGLIIIGCLISYANFSDIFFSMIIGLSYAFYLVSQRRNAGFDKFIVLTFHIVLSAVILFLFYPAFSGPIPVAFDFYIYLEIIAVAFTIIPLFLNLYSLNGLNSSTVGMLLNINPIIAFVLANVVYHEQISGLQLIAYTIIFISVLVFNVHPIFITRKK